MTAKAKNDSLLLLALNRINLLQNPICTTSQVLLDCVTLLSILTSKALVQVCVLPVQTLSTTSPSPPTSSSFFLLQGILHPVTSIIF